ncbi:MAG TPA: SDR family NAD(P)-dependent oxidoreductase [Solirubrobacteraceae bacterium]|nr:SDR family NAD(P)-dependent oxidoreductase [Solirubrobacteraceae bacterium]
MTVRTPFGFATTSAEVLEGVDLTGKRVVVTGASSGIGVETARALAAAGAEVTLAVRRLDAGRQVAAGIVEQTGNDAVTAVPLDLAELESVAAFVGAWTGPLHILVNNAGIMAVPERERTADGHELQFGTNFLGHFALTAGLHTALAAAGGARVVSLSSNAHWYSPVVFDDPDYRDRPYDPWSAYGQSKTACILLAVEVDRRWSAERVRANALNPGAIATGLQKYTGGMRTPVEKRKTVEQGAATSVLLAASPLLEGVGGRYFEDCNESEVRDEPPEMFGGGVARWALDPAASDRLWHLAAALVG